MTAEENGWDSMALRQKGVDPQFIIQQTPMEYLAGVVIGGKNKWHKMSQVASRLTWGKGLNKPLSTASLFGKCYDGIILEEGGLFGVQKRGFQSDWGRWCQEMLPRFMLRLNLEGQLWYKGKERGRESRGVLGRGLSTCKSMKVQNLGMSWDCKYGWRKGQVGGGRWGYRNHLEPDGGGARVLSSLRGAGIGLGCPLSCKGAEGRELSSAYISAFSGPGRVASQQMCVGC